MVLSPLEFRRIGWFGAVVALVLMVALLSFEGARRALDSPLAAGQHGAPLGMHAQELESQTAGMIACVAAVVNSPVGAWRFTYL